MHQDFTTLPAPQGRTLVGVRVSTRKQRDDGYSLDRQLADALQLAHQEAMRRGWPDVLPDDIHVDADSGKYFDRAGLTELLAKVDRSQGTRLLF
jgi:DNA invertase Pin-like site-specific DNA recombinase